MDGAEELDQLNPHIADCESNTNDKEERSHRDPSPDHEVDKTPHGGSKQISRPVSLFRGTPIVVTSLSTLIGKILGPKEECL